MSGTSCDALDCCDVNIEIDSSYDFEFKINKFSSIPFTNSEKSFLLSFGHKVDLKDYLQTKGIFPLVFPCFDS